MGMWNLGASRVVKAGGFQGVYNTRIFDGDGFPKSGTSGTGAGSSHVGAPKGSIYIDSDTGCAFKNEGTALAPYWTPVSFNQQGMMGWDSGNDFGFCDVSGVTTAGKPIADTAAAGVTSRGLKIDGQGIAEVDSGLVVALTATDGGGPVASMTTTDEDAHLVQLTVGDVAGTTPVYQADQNGTMVIDVSVSNSSAITLRNFFVGFHGDGTLALDPIMTYATTVITSVGTDIAGLAFSAELTDASSIFYVAFDAAGGATLTTTNVDTGVDMATAGTYQRMRVEVDADGVVRYFIAKTLVATSAAAALDIDEEVLPSLIIESTSTATKTLLVSHYQTWGKKVARP